MLKKKIIFLLFVFVVMGFVSGCEKKQTDVQNENQVINSQSDNKNNEEKSELVKEKDVVEQIFDLNFSDIKEWKTFREENFNFSFDYPANWEYLVKSLNTDWERIIFRSSIRNNELIIDIPAPSVGFEPWEIIETKVFKTNDINTDILIKHMKSKYGNDDMNIIFLLWQNGIKGDILENEFKFFESGSGMFILSRYASKNDAFYKSIMEKIAESFQFKK
jgi:hypothetical protein